MARTLIVGATSAIAAETAALLSQRGDRLFLIGRNAAKLEALRTRLGSTVSGTIIADLDETEKNSERIETAIEALGGLDVAIIAHGWLGDQLTTESDYEQAEAVIRTNFLSAVSVLMPIANHLERHGAGHIAVLSSVAGERGRPRNYTYGAAKGALTIYLQGLRSRLWGCGVRVHTIKLGPVHTPMTVGHPKNPLFAQPGPVARDIVATLETRVGERFVPWYWAPILGVVRRLPETVFQRLGFLSSR